MESVFVKHLVRLARELFTKEMYPKLYYVQNVEFGNQKYIVGSGVYLSSDLQRDELFDVVSKLDVYNEEIAPLD